MFPSLPELTMVVWQVTSCRKIFETGSLPRIHGKITTSPTDHDTATPARGSSKAVRFRNGRHLVRVRFYGSMGNVSCWIVLTPLPRLMVSASVAGAGKSVLWFVSPLMLSA